MDAVARLLENPPEGCRHIARLWKLSLDDPTKKPIPARELFAYWIGRSVLHELEHSQIEKTYAALDADTLKVMSDAIRDFRSDPDTVESYVDALRDAEIKA